MRADKEKQKPSEPPTGGDYRIAVFDAFAHVAAEVWDALLDAQDAPTPFMRHAYLQALHDSHSASAETGWDCHVITLWRDDRLMAACPLYVKSHSYGEYVFDWAWARAYAEHGLAYYPKAVIAVPFTPVPGSRLLARDAASRRALLDTCRRWCWEQGLSSLHLLFASDADLAAAHSLDGMPRQTVQFHWHRHGLNDFETLLSSLNQDKRKKIRQERRRVADAGVQFEVLEGHAITTSDWDFFYACYARTYEEHGNPPYLSRDFFARLAQSHAQHWVLFIAVRDGQRIACSLIAVDHLDTPQACAYGRYWGALQRVDSLHFEACYYQPLQWCLSHGVNRFEGGAQGEHKMARALLPTVTHSAHWLAHPAFAQAVDRFLQREQIGLSEYLTHLQERTPLRQTSG